MIRMAWELDHSDGVSNRLVVAAGNTFHGSFSIKKIALKLLHFVVVCTSDENWLAFLNDRQGGRGSSLPAGKGCWLTPPPPPT